MIHLNCTYILQFLDMFFLRIKQLIENINKYVNIKYTFTIFYQKLNTDLKIRLLMIFEKILAIKVILINNLNLVNLHL